jgi:hypothetical protein
MRPLPARPATADDASPTLWSPAPDVELALLTDVIAPGILDRFPELRRRLRAKAWRSYGGTVVMHSGPLTAEQADWVAILRSGLGAVLAAASGMRAGGVRMPAPPRPQVVVPWWRDTPRVPGVDVRRSRVMSGTEVHPSRQPPQFRLARATVDAASLCRRPDDVRALLCRPVQQRKATVPDLRRAVLRVGPVSGRGLMLRTLDDLELGAQSTHELRLVRALRRAGLPQPDRQVWRTRADGRSYLDCAWERWSVFAEVDGLGHLLVSQWVDDVDRANELVISDGGRHLRIVGFLLLEQEARVVDQLRRALQAGGWPGTS